MSAALAFGAHGRLASAQAGEVWIWDHTTRQRQAVFRADQTRVYGVAFSPDGSELTLNGPSSSAQIWNLTGETPRMLRNVRRGWRTDGSTEFLVLKGFGSSIARLAFGPGRRLVLALRKPSEDAVRTWECEVCGPGDQVFALAKQRLTYHRPTTAPPPGPEIIPSRQPTFLLTR